MEQVLHNGGVMRLYVVVAFCAAALAGCSGDKSADASTKVKKDQGKESSPKVAAQPVQPPGPGSQTHVNGMVRFKDPGVYADGKLVGMMKFGELPAPLEVYWHEEEATVEEGPNKPKVDPTVKQRRYNFENYFAALGLDTKRIKEIHIYSASKRRSSALIVTGDEMRKAPAFTFRFGSDVYGKPIPACPNGLGKGKCPDSLGQVTVYIDREPPEYEDGYFYFGDKLIEGVPYYGAALRGGVRVYHDGPHAATIKRKFLRGKGIGKLRPDGVTEWNLWGFFEKSGVDTSKIVEAWIVQNDVRKIKLTRDELMKTRFIAKSGQSGEVFFGKNETPVNALHLHSRQLEPDELPKAMEWELHNYE